LQAGIPAEEQEKQRLIATAALGNPEIKIWKFGVETLKMEPYMTITTSCANGMRFLL